jgi:class 3 adenylate cyclase
VGDVLAALGRADRAADAYDLALAAADESAAGVEQARATYGRARVEHDRPGGSVDVVRRLCARAVALAEGLGLASLAARASALGRIAVDRPVAVAARGGRWCVVLVTDVVGSSLVSTEAGDSAYHRLIQDHYALVRTCASRHGGHEFSESGDGLLLSFPSTAAAVRTAFDVRDAATIAAAREAAPQLRLALAGGEPLWDGGRPYGQVVNRAARLVALADDGEIVADEAVAGDLPLGVVATHRRTVALKNMGEHDVVTLSADVRP